MLLEWGSLALIVFVSLYGILASSAEGAQFRRLAVSGLALTAGAAMGAAAVQAAGYGLAVPLAAAVLFAAAGAALMKRRAGGAEALAWAGASVAGSCIGIAAGMTAYSTGKAMYVIDVAFIVLMFGLLRLRESRKPQQQAKSRSSQAANPASHRSAAAAWCSIAALSCVLLLVLGSAIPVGQYGRQAAAAASYDSDNDLQEAQIVVSAAGITPERVDFKRGAMIKAIVVVKADAGSGLTLDAGSLGAGIALSKGENVIVLNNPQPGSYSLTVKGGRFGDKGVGALFRIADEKN